MAVFTYVIAGLPLIWIALQELGLVNKTLDQMGKLKIHAMMGDHQKMMDGNTPSSAMPLWETKAISTNSKVLQWKLNNKIAQ